MKKTFIEVLKEQDPKKLIYLGMKDGTNWVLIETAETLIDKIDDIDELLHEMAERTLKEAQESMNKNLLRMIDYQLELLVNAGRWYNEKQIKSSKDSLRTAEYKFVNAYNRREATSEKLRLWIKAGDRKVIDTYPHTVDDPGLSIIVEGDEKGTLWWKGEHEVSI